jgi:hypothetical protein
MDVGATENSSHWKEQDEVWSGKKFYTHSKQVAKYSDKIKWGYWPNEESKYAPRNMELSITGEVLDSTFHHTNHYIFYVVLTVHRRYAAAARKPDTQPSTPHCTDNLKAKHQIRQAATTCIIL